MSQLGVKGGKKHNSGKELSFSAEAGFYQFNKKICVNSTTSLMNVDLSEYVHSEYWLATKQPFLMLHKQMKVTKHLHDITARGKEMRFPQQWLVLY